ncbi:putative porin [Pseudobdellovibrio exovorus]|uniref:Alginate export domain-containing protein n=1 Tax=Pseudobdellovibrio exovorus JSS TaxID=1184267 RepID=M4VBG5_9BACT|nr:putative porin [Pseudobdellovibrio exovorus]AGH95366.1 hypothetical protein A11Q_1150 [Pseudobdellovibrio exovorus JSS]
MKNSVSLLRPLLLICSLSMTSLAQAQESIEPEENKPNYLQIPVPFNGKFYGDFRFRTEKIQEQQLAPLKDSDLLRQRMRLRIGGSAEVNSQTEVGVRLSTDSALGNEPNTTNQDLSGYYSKKSIVLDLAYFNWKATENIRILGGKTPLPFEFVADNDLIFDNDVTPEGLSVKYNQTVDLAHDLMAVASATWLNERYSADGSAENTDVGLLALQLGYAFKGADFGIRAVGSYLNFANIKGDKAPAAKGNTVDGGGNYVHNYELSSLGLELFSEVAGQPISFFAEYVKNSRDDDYNTAQIYGIQFGELKDVSSWAVTLDYRQVEKDAVVGLLTDSDSAGGGTDIRSWKTSLAYQVGRNANVALTYFNGKEAISSPVFSPDYQRTMLDFNFSF